MPGRLLEIFQFFFKFGWVAFGGPAAHVALMEEELVEKRKWLTTEEYLDYMGATNLIPGPNSTEMTMHCGYHRGGPAGLFVAGMSFIVPAVCITLAIAVFFEEFSQIEWIVPIINGIKAAVISFIVAAILKLGKKAVKTKLLVVIGLCVIVGSYFGINEILCILTAGLIGMMIKAGLHKRQLNSLAIVPLFFFLKVNYTHLTLFLTFLKVGAVLFGSGYVLFAYLDGEFIDNMNWLSHPDLVEAIAIGQITPGPVLSTATFIGYKLGGFQGAILATIGIFVPSFFYVWLLNPILKKIKSNPLLKGFLEAVNVAAVAVMVVVTMKMMESILIDWKTIMICVLSFVIYFTIKKMNPMWIIVGGGILGWMLSYL